MSKVNDLTGKTFGMLTVVERTTSCPKTKKARWVCKCSCGNETVVTGNSLSRNNTTSCGCYRPNQVKDYSGQRFGRLLVMSFHSLEKTNAKFLCKCDCGNEIVTLSCNLVKGETRSCGCYRAQCLSERSRVIGGSKSKEYICWIAMRDRVKNNMYYIRRGIIVCEGYRLSYPKFQNDIGKQPKGMKSVDRIDNNGNYSCGKCEECKRNGWKMNIQWANAKMQCNNTSRNRVFTYKGIRKSVSQWSDITGIKRETLYYRLVKFKWPIEKALTSKGKLANKPTNTIFELQNNV